MSQIEEMQTFVRIVEAGSITLAAEQMNTVKSAVSKRLTELESRLGISLIKRTTRKQSLTDAGQVYYQNCLRILDDINEMESSLNANQQNIAGRIRLAAPSSFGLLHISKALTEFNTMHPDIIFDIDFNDRQQDLIAEGIDLAIRISNLADSSLIARKLTTTNLILCASPDYLAQHGKPEQPEELLYDHVKLQYSNVNPTWELRNQQGKQLSVNIPIAMQSNNGEFLLDAAIAGKGIVFSPDFICYQAMADGKLISILEDSIINKAINVYAVYPQTRYLSKRVRILIEYLKQYFSQPRW